MSATGPLVSICIPVYNGERFLHEAIGFVINQTYRNLEIIFSDNCSTDRSVEIIKSYNDPRIRLYSNESNMGVKYNYLKAFTYATGKYMTFMGADDGMDLTTIEKSVKVLEDPANSDVTIVNGYVSIINDTGRHVHLKKFLFRGGRCSGYWAIRANFLYGTNIIGEPNGAVFRRSAYEKIPEPKLHNGNKWTNDLDLLCELLLQGDLYIIPEPLGKFRISSEGQSFREIRFTQARLFRKYAYTIYKDKRYKLSFLWLIPATINSMILSVARNIFYIVVIRKKK